MIKLTDAEHRYACAELAVKYLPTGGGVHQLIEAAQAISDFVSSVSQAPKATSAKASRKRTRR